MARNNFKTSLLTAFLVCFCLLGSFPALGNAARIVVFSSAPSRSHQMVHFAVADTLARAGHDVTVIAAVPNVYKKAQYKYLELPNVSMDQSLMKNAVNKPQPLYKTMFTFITSIFEMSNKTLNEPKMREFLAKNGPGTVDLLLFGYFLNDFALGLGAHFRCPIIISWTVQPNPAINKFIGNPNEIAYVPSMMVTDKPPLNFLQRVKNFLMGIIEGHVMPAVMDYFAKEYYNYNFPPALYPSFDEVSKNVSLVFSNHHFSQGPIRPNVPNLIEIGGIQIKDKTDPLPADIAQVLDASKEGVIYFSFGSNVQSNHLTADKIQILYNVVSKLPYKVLWKWNETDIPGKSANIVYKNWLPQDDILAHPNVKLFITHGGMGSIVESQYHGVPMVGIPLFADQPSNMAKVVRAGYGVSVDFLTMTEKSLSDAIHEVLNNPKYTETVVKFSKLYRDRPMTARQSVLYWTDYVLRHKGAKHMQSPAVHMNYWQLRSLDVIAFILAIVLVVVVSIIKLCQVLCCRKKKYAQVTKNKKDK